MGMELPEVFPKKYLIATLFIAAMLVILAVVQAPRAGKSGGVAATNAPAALMLESYETLAEYRLQEGWAPRFQGAQDPDQPEPWPFPGGFGLPWEPASPYLSDQALALNGPGEHSEVVLWRGLEWRHYRFDVPLASARLDPVKGNRLLVTLARGRSRFETRLLEVPEGRVLWSTDSGPWSRFSWDGRAVLTGLRAPEGDRLLLASLPVDAEIPHASLAAWAEKGLPAPPRNWPVKIEQLWDDGKDMLGAKLLVPWAEGGRLWFPRHDRLWISAGGTWTLWAQKSNAWCRVDAGPGVLDLHPPRAVGRISVGKDDVATRTLGPVDEAQWRDVPKETPPWPAFDPAWTWVAEDLAITGWDRRWGHEPDPLPVERQREALAKAFNADYRVAADLRASVAGWLPEGPEIALREGQGVAWVWLGDRVRLVRLQPTTRLRQMKSLLRLR